MPNSNKNIKAALKNVLVPHLAAEGFTGQFPEFIRREGNTLHLLSIQFNKWGGGFFLEFEPHPAGNKVMPWGEIVPEEELTAAHAPFDSRARLQESGSDSSMRESWFRFDVLDLIIVTHRVGIAVPLQGT